MGKSRQVEKKPQPTAKPIKRHKKPKWDDYKDKQILLHTFHLLNVGEPNFRELSEVMGRDIFTTHHLRTRFWELTTSLEEIKKYREMTESLFVSDDNFESEDDFRNGHSEVHVVIGDGSESEQPSPASDATFDSTGSDSGYCPTSSPISDPVTPSPTPRYSPPATTRALPIREMPLPEDERYLTESQPRGDSYRPQNHSRRARYPNRYGPPADAPRQPAANRNRQRSRRRPDSSRNSGHNFNVTSQVSVNTTRRDDRRNSGRRG